MVSSRLAHIQTSKGDRVAQRRLKLWEGLLPASRERPDMSRKKTKSRHMTDETFSELMKSAKQALAYERGEVSGHRVTRIAVPRPPQPMSSADIARIRLQLNYSQSVFARVLNVSPKT